MKMNCWEFKKCGREPNGLRVKELGICAAASETRVNGLNSGVNGGRCCWAVAGTLCGGKVQGSFAVKMTNCMNCDFFKMVSSDERNTNTLSKLNDILKKLK